VRAVYKGQLEMVRTLIDHGADVNATRENGFTPLGLAAFFGHTEVVRVLVEQGADIGKATRFGTPEEMAATARSFYEVGQHLERERSRAAESNAPQSSANELGVMPAPPENETGDEISTGESFRAEQQQQPSPADSGVTIETPRMAVTDQLISQPAHESSGTGQEYDRRLAKPLLVRTLKEPPEIWDLVQETPEHFNPRSAFVTRLTSSKTNLVLLMLAVVLITGLSTFAVMKLRDRKNGVAAAQVQEEPGPVDTVPASQASAPASVPVNAPASAPADEQVNSELNTTPSSDSGADNTVPQPTAQSTNRQTTDSQPQDSQPIAQSDNASSSEALTSTGQPTSVSNVSKRTASRAGRGRNVDKRLARGESENLASTNTSVKFQPPQTADLKQNDDKRSSDSSAKKGSNPTPQIAPPTTSSTPKPKVIQWP
jgi:ankyrin repeat protein